MFEQVRDKVDRRGETVQVQVMSDKLVPSVEVREDKRVLVLDHEGYKYPCLERGWVSWADKVLVPAYEERKKNGLHDEDGRNNRWSIGTVRNFLNMTPTNIANDVLRSWWERHTPTQWNIIKYADNGSLGPIRYIGTNRYRLYRHDDFLSDLEGCGMGELVIKDSAVTENRMLVRLTGTDSLPIEGVNVHAGYHIFNSENGSSSIGIKHLIYDEVCTNGLIIILDSKNILNQRHSNFDVESLRGRVSDISSVLGDIHEKATSLVSKLIGLKLTSSMVEAVFRMYKKMSDASEVFIGSAKELQARYGNTAWGVMSSITEAAQRYDWGGRVVHEEHASDLISRIENGDYERYVDKKKEEDAN